MGGAGGEDAMPPADAPPRRRRSVAFAMAALAVLAVGGALAGALASTSNPEHGGGALTSRPARPCTSSVVDDVLAGTAGVTVGYLPRGFRLQEGTPADIGPGQYGSPVYYEKRTKGNPWASTISIQSAPASEPLGRSGGNNFTGSRVSIDGHRGLLVLGQPDAPSNSIWWDTTNETQLGVSGFLVPTPELLQVARSVVFHPQRVVALPLTAGHMVSRNRALEVAALPGAVALAAKLSSYDEVTALLDRSEQLGQRTAAIRSGRGSGGTPAAPAGLAAAPWTPVWAVVLAPAASAHRGIAGASSVALVIAATGRVAARMPAGPQPAWFGWLTDRDPAERGCPGGTTARVPFGLLTRTEESDVAPAGRITPGEHATLIVGYKLASQPAIYASGSDLLGGCVQYCDLATDVWIVLRETKADPGTTVLCATPTGPAGRRGRQVKAFTTVSYADGFGLSCAGPPAWFLHLKDLAPAPPS